MFWIIEKLIHEADWRENMIGTTPPTTWKESLEDWNTKEQKAIEDLRAASKILKEHIPSKETNNSVVMILMTKEDLEKAKSEFDFVISLDNKERLFLLKFINKEINKAKQKNTPVNKLTMLYNLQIKLRMKKNL